MSKVAPYPVPTGAITVNRAARILHPAAGSLEGARALIWAAIGEQRLTVYPSRPSPSHPAAAFSKSQAKPEWFLPENERRLCEGLQSSSEASNAWGEFLHEGGLLLDRSEVEALDGPGAWLTASDAFVAEMRNGRTNWNLPQALAWVATRDYREVAQIAFGGTWHPPPDDEKPAIKVMREATERASIGLLVRRVSLQHCQCRAQTDELGEAWEKCSCTTAAFDKLLDAIRDGKLAAYDEIAGAPVEPAQLPGFRLALPGFGLGAPTYPGSVSFRRTDLERLWPQERKRAGRKATYLWDAFKEIVKEKLWDEGGFHGGWIQADCEREMKAWCDRNWEKTPGESQIRDKINEAEEEWLREKAAN